MDTVTKEGCPVAQQKKELFSKWRDWTQKNRNWILYAAGILTLFGLAGGAAMLPEQVALQAVQEGQTAALVDKEMALGATGGLTVFFGLLFALRPRELVYFVALCLAVFLVYSLLMINVVL